MEEKTKPFRLVKYFTFASLIVIFIGTIVLSFLNIHWARTLQFKKSQDYALLLIENGVYGALPGYAELFTRLPGAVQCYLLENDAEARGLKDLNQDFRTVSYDGFVELSCRYDKVVSWF